MITLVLGGTRSGKSAMAERLAAADGTTVTYVATARVEPGDADHRDRVARHRARRPEGWTTVEAGADLLGALTGLQGTVLVDSLGSWVAACHALDADVGGLVEVLRGRAGHTVVVSEEVGLGVHPSTELGRRFRDVLGELNRAVAEAADQAYFVVAGRVVPLERAPW